MIYNTDTGSANVPAIKGLALFPLQTVLFEGFAEVAYILL